MRRRKNRGGTCDYAGDKNTPGADAAGSHALASMVLAKLSIHYFESSL
jgi:hypothetical protein